jgi:hypothetical protein
LIAANRLASVSVSGMLRTAVPSRRPRRFF